MALEWRAGKLYQYKSLWRGGRVVKVYGGAGSVALTFHEYDQANRELKRWCFSREVAEYAAFLQGQRARQEALDAFLRQEFSRARKSLRGNFSEYHRSTGEVEDAILEMWLQGNRLW